VQSAQPPTGKPFWVGGGVGCFVELRPTIPCSYAGGRNSTKQPCPTERLAFIAPNCPMFLCRRAQFLERRTDGHHHPAPTRDAASVSVPLHYSHLQGSYIFAIKRGTDICVRTSLLTIMSCIAVFKVRKKQFPPVVPTEILFSLCYADLETGNQF